MITVVDINGVPPVREGGAEVSRFLNHQTVGARSVEGMAYRLGPNGSAGPFVEAAGYQLFYVTAGQPVAVYQGKCHELGPGRGVYCEPGESCVFENPAGEPAAFYRFIVPA
ncbi:MAG: hypothetical protein HYY65_12200 [Candidatus Tectomicrobia bacterium]|uniref:Cupin domain-containing protein n=1 Tax=Tectimicrobiota bacterium TaxID=2528274 RepID=A0A932M1F5_UNCTE|nr:hypothetical protein [Candidatus Tectomicrobia bacterium]